MFDRKNVRHLVLGATGMAAAGALYVFVIEPRWLEVTRPRIRVPGLPPALDGLRIALVSDLHVGHGTALGLVKRACRLVRREAPDMVAVTGDVADERGDVFDAAVRQLGRLEAPLGVYAVPGNRAYSLGIARWRQTVGAVPGLVDLTDRSRVLRVGDSRLAVVGVHDLEGGDAGRDVEPVDPAPNVVVALAHRPDHIYRLQQHVGRIDLMLAGHTHGGQVRLPGLGALIEPWRREEVGRQGLQQMAGTSVYVSRGLGTTHLPVRLFCRPEVAVIELTG